MTTSPLEYSPRPSPKPSLDEGARQLQHQREPHSPFRPHEELHFDFPPVSLTASLSQSKTHYSHLPRDPTVRKMISVPEMRPGLPVNPSMHRQNSTGISVPRPRVTSHEYDRERGGNQLLPKQVKRRIMEHGITMGESFEITPVGGDRLAKQKSMERGMLVGPPPMGHSPQGKRAASNGDRRPGRRTPPVVGPPPPGLRMPLAFNSIARERGFTTGSPTPGPQDFPPLPHPRHPSTHRGPYPSNSAPDLYGIGSENRHYPPRRDPRNAPRSHPYSPHPVYSNDTSANTSTNTSPHSSIGPIGPPYEIRGSFRSALFTEEYRSSTGTSLSERTEDSHAMTVDEAIGMYGSDTDEESIMREAREEENRRSKGDSVLGGATSRHNSVSDGMSIRGSHGDSVMSGMSRRGSFELERIRSHGDSVLGGEMSPETRSKMTEQEIALQRELDLQRMSRNADHSEDNNVEVEEAEDQPVETKQEIEENRDTRAVEAGDKVISEEDESHPEPLATSEVLETIPKSSGFLASDTPKTPPSTDPRDARDRYGYVIFLASSCGFIANALKFPEANTICYSCGIRGMELTLRRNFGKAKEEVGGITEGVWIVSW